MALENSTRRLGKAIREFESRTCTEIPTYVSDLPSDDAARAKQRRNAPTTTSNTTGTRKIRKLNLSTYKLHALGHYVNAIRKYGPCDGYSTQTVSMSRLLLRKRAICLFQGEAEHKRVKKHYKRVSKSNFTKGITQQNHRERTMRKMWKQKEHVDELEKENLTRNSSGTGQSAQIIPSNARNPGPTNRDQEKLPYTAPEVHHHMSLEMKHKVDLATWLSEHEDDVACRVR